MDNMWSGVGSYFNPLFEKIHNYEKGWQDYLFPSDSSAQGAAGYPSNIRHSAAASALSNTIANKLHGWFATPGYENEKPSGLFDWGGKLAALVAMTGHEIPTYDSISNQYDSNKAWNQITADGRSLSPGHPSENYDPDWNQVPGKINWLNNQYTEDMLANAFGIFHGGDSTDPNEEIKTLTPKLAHNKGIINNALFNIAENRDYPTRDDLIESIQMQSPAHPSNRDINQNERHRFFPHNMHMSNNPNQDQENTFNKYHGYNSGIENTQRGQGFAAGQQPIMTRRSFRAPGRGNQRLNTSISNRWRTPNSNIPNAWTNQGKERSRSRLKQRNP